MDYEELLKDLKTTPLTQKRTKELLIKLKDAPLKNNLAVLRFIISLKKMNMHTHLCNTILLSHFDTFHPSILPFHEETIHKDIPVYDLNKVIRAFRQRRFNRHYYTYIKAFEASILIIKDPNLSEKNVLEDFVRITVLTRRKRSYTMEKGGLFIHPEMYMFAFEDAVYIDSVLFAMKSVGFFVNLEFNFESNKNDIFKLMDQNFNKQEENEECKEEAMGIKIRYSVKEEREFNLDNRFKKVDSEEDEWYKNRCKYYHEV